MLSCNYAYRSMHFLFLSKKKLFESFQMQTIAQELANNPLLCYLTKSKAVWTNYRF
jgi:hypothetical protein